MYKKIFISHSSKDAQKAMAICEIMEKNGKKCFTAPNGIMKDTCSERLTTISAFLRMMRTIFM